MVLLGHRCRWESSGTILLGIGGSVVANLAITRGQVQDGISQPGCLASVLGAMVLIFVVRLLAG